MANPVRHNQAMQILLGDDRVHDALGSVLAHGGHHVQSADGVGYVLREP